MAFPLRKTIILVSLVALVGSGLAGLEKLQSAKSNAASAAVRAIRCTENVISRADGEIIFEWECPEIQIVRDEELGRITAIELAGSQVDGEPGVPQLPSLCQLLDCLPGQVSAQVLQSEVETRNLGAMAAMPTDFRVDDRPTSDGVSDPGRTGLDNAPPAQSWRERSAHTAFKPGLWPTQMVDVREGGVFRGHRLVSVVFHPVQVDAEHGLARIVKHARIRVTMPRAETAAPRLADDTHETAMVRAMLGPLAETARLDHMPEAFYGAPQQGIQDDEPIGGRWKLIVREEGIVRVRGDSLRMRGAPVDQINPIYLHVKNRGREIPVHFLGANDGRFDDADYVEFYGIPNRQQFQWSSPAYYTDPYSQDNVYWLSWNDGLVGLRLGEESGWHVGPEWGPQHVQAVDNVRVTMHFERDQSFDRLAKSDAQWTLRQQTTGPLSIYEDHWFWGDYIRAFTSRDFEVFIPWPDDRSLRPVSIRAALQGFSWSEASGPGAGSHRAVVYLDGQTSRGWTAGRFANDLSTPDWNGQSAVIVQSGASDSLAITSGDLLNGTNLFTVSLPGDGPAGYADKVVANWFEVSFDSRPRAQGGLMHFRFDTTRGDTFVMDLRGFTTPDIEVWRLGHSRLTNCDLRIESRVDEAPSYATRFHQISDAAYDIVAFDVRGTKPPFDMQPETSGEDLRHPASGGARYLIIYHDSFAGDLSLLRLDSLRRASFGGSVDTIRVSQVYEQFNYGIVSADAIRNFLQYAYEHWTVRPTSVCLIGDGLINNRASNLSGNLIPSVYPTTDEFGIAASDGMLGQVSGPPWDVIPDIAIGRISCRSPEELQTYVEKLVNYEDPTVSDYGSPFHSTVLFVADRRDPTFNFGRDFSEPTIHGLTQNCNVARVYLDSLSAGQGPSTLRNEINKGAVIVNYNGHGGGGVWSQNNLLDVPSVRLLSNRAALPFISNFTCYVGSFDDRDQSGVLGEALLFSRNIREDPVGAIGVYSSTGVGWAIAGTIMQSYLFDFCAEPPGLTQGEIVQINKARFWSSRGSTTIGFESEQAMMMMMTLLGDPGVHLALPQQTWTTLTADTAIVTRADTVHFSGTLPWDPAARGTNTAIYAFPYNGDSYTYIYGPPTWDPARQETIRVVVDVIFQSTRIPLVNTDLFVPQFVNTRTLSSLPMLVSPRRGGLLATAEGRVVVYAVDPGRAAQNGNAAIPPVDAIFTMPIFFADSLQSIRITNVGVMPDGVILNDSTFRIRADVLYRNGIASVRARGFLRPAQGPVELDTVAMTSSDGVTWQTPLLGPHHILGGSYRVEFIIQPNDGAAYQSDSYNLLLEMAVDLSINSYGGDVPHLQPGNQPYLSVPIGIATYPGARAIRSVDLLVKAVHDTTVFIHQLPPQHDTTIVVIVDSFSVRRTLTDLGLGSNMFSALVPMFFKSMPYRVTVTVDPDTIYTELTRLNNSYVLNLNPPNLYPATNQLGSYLPRLTPPGNETHVFWKPGIQDSLWLNLLPGSLNTDSTTLIYGNPVALTSAEMLTLRNQGVLSPPPGQKFVQTFRVLQADSSDGLSPAGHARVTRNFRLTLLTRDPGGIDTTFVSQLALLYRRSGWDAWRLASNRRLENYHSTQLGDTARFVTGLVSGDVASLGQFAVLRVVDSLPPTIEMTVGGLTFTPSSLVPRHPAIWIALSDYSGVDHGPGKFSLSLDGDTLHDADITWSDTTGSQERSYALIRPELVPGNHHIHVRATDNTGLTDSVSVDFLVRGVFGFDWVINYPNPFARSTTIAYVVTDETSDYVEIKIYSVSGRFIRSLRESERIVANYREIAWDGRDFRQEEVANGVYFARIKAKQGNQEVEKVIKMAKIR